MEYYEDDVNKFADVARSATGIATLHEATRVIRAQVHAGIASSRSAAIRSWSLRCGPDPDRSGER